MKGRIIPAFLLSLYLAVCSSCFMNFPAAAEGKGWASMDMGQYKTAIEHFDTAIDKWPEDRYDHCPPYCGKVIAYTYLGEWEEIIPVCDELISLDCGDLFAWPNRIDAWPYIRKGVAYLNLGDYDAALTNFDTALDIHTATELELYEAHVGRGNVLFERGEYEKAIEEYTLAIAIDYPFEDIIHKQDYAYYCYYFEKDAYVLRGKAYEALGRTDEAMADYKRAGEVGVY